MNRPSDYEEGLLLMLQTFYEIAEYKAQIADTFVKGISAIRRMLFWDVDFDKMQWGWSKEYAKVLWSATTKPKNPKYPVIRVYNLTLKNP